MNNQITIKTGAVGIEMSKRPKSNEKKYRFNTDTITELLDTQTLGRNEFAREWFIVKIEGRKLTVLAENCHNTTVTKLISVIGKPAFNATR